MDKNRQFAQIGADGKTAQAALDKVKAHIAALESAGVYTRHNLALKQYADLAALENRAEFLPQLVKIMKRSWDTDIGDFDLKPRKGLVGAIESGAKKCVWTLMKFYTFRMFSQTKAYNLQVATAMTSLARRLDKIEKTLGPAGKDGGH